MQSEYGMMYGELYGETVGNVALLGSHPANWGSIPHGDANFVQSRPKSVWGDVWADVWEIYGGLNCNPDRKNPLKTKAIRGTKKRKKFRKTLFQARRVRNGKPRLYRRQGNPPGVTAVGIPRHI